MKIGSDIIKVYKDVHIWIGITCGLMLFIAFYAGAVTMFEQPLHRWATPPSQLSDAPPLEDAEKLLAAVVAVHPEAANRYRFVVTPTPDEPARLIWAARGERPREFIEHGASFAPDGSLQVEPLRKSPAAQLVDRMHQFVGLPMPDTVARYVMGAVALAYAVALLSGLIVLLPTLVKDVFALRAGKNIKRMWLDAHNALGIFSLPFHLVIALTSVVFAFHDPFYDTQAKALYGGEIDWGGHEEAPTGAAPHRQPAVGGIAAAPAEGSGDGGAEALGLGAGLPHRRHCVGQRRRHLGHAGGGEVVARARGRSRVLAPGDLLRGVLRRDGLGLRARCRPRRGGPAARLRAADAGDPAVESRRRARHRRQLEPSGQLAGGSHRAAGGAGIRLDRALHAAAHGAWPCRQCLGRWRRASRDALSKAPGDTGGGNFATRAAESAEGGAFFATRGA